MRLSLCMSLCVSMHLFVSLCVSVRPCACLCVSYCLCVSLYLSMYLFTCVCACVHFSLCVLETLRNPCASVWVSMCLWLPKGDTSTHKHSQAHTSTHIYIETLRKSISEIFLVTFFIKEFLVNFLLTCV